MIDGFLAMRFLRRLHWTGFGRNDLLDLGIVLRRIFDRRCIQIQLLFGAAIIGWFVLLGTPLDTTSGDLFLPWQNPPFLWGFGFGFYSDTILLRQSLLIMFLDESFLLFRVVSSRRDERERNVNC